MTKSDFEQDFKQLTEEASVAEKSLVEDMKNNEALKDMEKTKDSIRYVRPRASYMIDTRIVLLRLALAFMIAAVAFLVIVILSDVRTIGSAIKSIEQQPLPSSIETNLESTEPSQTAVPFSTIKVLEPTLLPINVSSTLTSSSSTPVDTISPSTTEAMTYTVKPGDTLQNIANYLGLTVIELGSLNPNLILKADQIVKLPLGQKAIFTEGQSVFESQLPKYFFPVQPPEITEYGQAHHDYPATDIFAPANSVFVAVTDGIIDEVGYEDQWNPKVDDPQLRSGRYVSIIGNDGVRYYGSHLASVVPGLKQGQRVPAGQILGYVGNSGNARGIQHHLHFGISHPTFAGDWKVRRGEISPFPYLNAWRNWENLAPELPSDKTSSIVE